MDLDLPEGLLVRLGHAATSPDSPLDFKQAQKMRPKDRESQVRTVGVKKCMSRFLNSESHVVQPTGRHLANRCHLNARGSPDCLRTEICPLVPYFAQCGWITQGITPLCECVNILKTNLRKQEPTPMTSWTLQLPGALFGITEQKPKEELSGNRREGRFVHVLLCLF